MLASISKPPRRLGWRRTVLFIATAVFAVISLMPTNRAAAYAGHPRASAPIAYVADAATDCSGSGSLSWALCPLTELIVNATNYIEQWLIIPYLSVSPLGTDTSSPVFRLWETIRNIANILFIIVFFVVIFSQATSVGLSNYGIKRMLPRMVWVAILANLSYYLIAFVIDAFNIFGAGVAQLVLGILGQTGGTAPGTPIPAFVQIAVPLTVLGIGASMGWLWSLLGAILLIVLVAVVVLVLRQMLILLLVVVSPLLAVAELLPNTEKYAERGWTALFKLLLMYPLIILVFAVGNIIGALLQSNNIVLSTGAANSTQVTDIIKQVFVALAKAAPLLLLPGLFAAAGKVLESAHNTIRQQSQNIGNRGRQAYQNSSFSKYREQQRQVREQNIAAGNYKARSKGSWFTPGHYTSMARSRMNRGRNTNPFLNTVTGGYGASQVLTNNQQRQKERSQTQGYFNEDFDLAEAWLKARGNRNTTYKYTPKATGEMYKGKFYKAGEVMDTSTGAVASAVGDYANDQYIDPSQFAGISAKGGMDRSYFKDLSQTRRNTFNQMSNAGLTSSGDSYIAAMELVAKAGRGNNAMAQEAFSAIKALNPASGDNDVDNLATTLRSTWRDKGRGDLAGDYDSTTRRSSNTIFTPTKLDPVKGEVSAFSDVNLGGSTRHIFNPDVAPEGVKALNEFIDRDGVPNAASTAAGKTGRNVGEAAEHIRKIVEDFPKMERRTREQFEEKLFTTYNGKPTISGAPVLDSSGAPAGNNYATDKATFLAQLRQEMKLVPK